VWERKRDEMGKAVCFPCSGRRATTLTASERAVAYVLQSLALLAVCLRAIKIPVSLASGGFLPLWRRPCGGVGRLPTA
jgi:hypothetical protein